MREIFNSEANWPLAAIFVRNVPFVAIGSSASGIGTNEISNHGNGIVAIRSRIRVENSTFKNIVQEYSGWVSVPGEAWPVIPGYALDTWGGSCVVEGFGSEPTDIAMFEDMPKGIVTTNAITEVSDVRFLNAGVAVSVEDRPVYSNIQDNIVMYDESYADCYDWGAIDIEQGRTGKDYVENNKIGYGGSASSTESHRGIEIYTDITSGSEMIVWKNKIIADHGGIRLFGSWGDDIIIRNNNVKVHGGLYGMKAANFTGEDLKIWYNSFGIAGVDYGLLIERVQNALICADTFPGAEVGLEIRDNCDETGLFTNYFKDHNVGLRYYDGQTQDQEWHRNQWHGSYSNWGAEWVAMEDFYMPEYKVNTDPLTGGASYHMPPSVSHSEWFKDRIGNGSGCEILPFALTGLDSLIIQDSLDLAFKAKLWNLRYDQYQSIKRNNVEGGIIDSFLQDYQNSQIDSFYRVESRLRDLFVSNTQERNDLESMIEILIYLQDSAQVLYDSLMLYDTLAVSDSTINWVEEYNEVTYDLYIQDSLYSKLMDEIHDRVEDSIGAIREFNALINTDTTYDHNLKYVFELTARSQYRDFEFTQGEKDSIIILAEGCPNEEGLGVYYARNLVHKIDTSLDFQYCIPSEQQQSQLENEAFETLFDHQLQVYPNPAGERLYINLPRGETASGLYLTDMSGRIVLKDKAVDSHQFDVDVASIEDGTYVLTVSTVNGQKLRKKIIITR